MNSQGSPDGLAFSYRLNNVEEEIRSIKAQLDRYETTRENELKLQGIKDSLRRIENDVSEIHQKVIAQEQVVIAQEKASKDRDVEQQQEQARFKIRVLYGVLSVLVGIVATVVAALIINFLTHLPPR